MKCEDCIKYDVCQEIESLPCRDKFVWYRAESGCPYFKDKNTIIELPKLDFGQDVWIIYKGKIKQLKVTGLNFKVYGCPAKEIIPMKYGHFDILLWLGGFTWGCTVNDIGKTVFLSKAEAENKLKVGDMNAKIKVLPRDKCVEIAKIVGVEGEIQNTGGVYRRFL